LAQIGKALACEAQSSMLINFISVKQWQDFLISVNLRSSAAN